MPKLRPVYKSPNSEVVFEKVQVWDRLQCPNVFQQCLLQMYWQKSTMK